MGKPFLPKKSQLSEQDLKKQEEKFRELLKTFMDKAEEFGCTIRVIGSIAFRIKAPEYSYIEYKNKRYLTDIDFVTYKDDIVKVQDMFFSMGWKEDQGVLRLFGDKRRIFYHPTVDLHSDIFIDKLRFCHDVDLRNRLELDNPTISLIDLILEKLQIVKINKKDLVDIMILLRKFEISFGKPDQTTIDGSYLVKICSQNWGWWKTATKNLVKVTQFSQDYLEPKDAKVVIQKVNLLLENIRQHKKSIFWKIRNLFGEKFKWYNEVEEVHR